MAPTSTRKQRSSMSALDAIYQRRSVRAYTSEKLKHETIRSLLEAAVQAPTAVHEEPWLFSIVQDAALLRRISDRAKELWKAPDETPGHPLSAAARALHERMKQADFNVFYDASTLVVIAGKPLGPFVVADCWLAAENLMLAACALGLGSCPIGFSIGALNAPDIKASLEIPAQASVVAAVILGVPSGETPASPRKEPEVTCWR